MVISCDDCVIGRSATCAECVVSVVLGTGLGIGAEDAVERAIRLLVNAGLVSAHELQVA